MHDVPMELVRDDVSQQEYEAMHEEAHYYFTLNSLIDLVKRHGYKKVLKDLEELLAIHR